MEPHPDRRKKQIALLPAGVVSAEVITDQDAESRLLSWTWTHDGVSVQLLQLLPDQRRPATARFTSALSASAEDFDYPGDFLEASYKPSVAAKRVLAWQLRQAMENLHLNKMEMARRMRTSRSQLDRLLDPDNDKVQLDALNRAAAIVGKRVKVELVEKRTLFLISSLPPRSRS